MFVVPDILTTTSRCLGTFGSYTLTFLEERAHSSVSRAMLRDEQLYPDPDAFRPERFLEKVDHHIERTRDPRNYVFGFGRRSVRIFRPH